jgi:glutamate dehydrogenase (NAD(P)+)
MVTERACTRLGWRLGDQRCVVQGFGNVGAIAAHELAARGATVVAVSDVSGGVHDEDGLDLPDLTAWLAERSSLADYPRARHVSNAELLELDCDVLVLAAREDQVTARNAADLRCRLIAEGANGPVSVEAEAILAARRIPVLPDILTNAGGVTVSYFEWVQDLGRLFWDRDEIRRRLAEKLGGAFDRVWDLAERDGTSLRDAALIAGIREVAAALEARGMYP